MGGNIKPVRVRNATAELTILARTHRKTMTPAERVLWEAIRGAKLDGLSFRRQHPVATFIVDFFCPVLRLVLEVDGGIHDDPDVAAHDRERQTHIEAYGWQVLRIRNEEILTDLPTVLETIRNVAQTIQATTLRRL